MSIDRVKIDYAFIAELEGGNILQGYVPDPENSKSGVTLGVGFDLGARDYKDLMRLAISPDAIQLLNPYLGLQGMQAKKFLDDNPLTITEPLANALNTGAKTAMIENLIKRYDGDSQVSFVDIPAKWQTVIASVEFQYGSTQRRCPTFWKYTINQDWDRAIKELRNFGDRYPTRRNREADYILR